MSCMALVGMSQNIDEMVKNQLSNYPKSRLLDIYKSCFQDFMGAEHLVGDTLSVRRYLEYELQQIEGDSLMSWYAELCGLQGRYVRMGAEHLVGDTLSVRRYLEYELQQIEGDSLMSWYAELCGLQGRYVRVSLRVVQEGLVSLDQLLSAFIRSANGSVRPSVEVWKAEWEKIVGQIDEMRLGLPHYDNDRHFIADALAQGKYAISHSPDYRAAYRPHYRIVRRDIFERELKPLLSLQHEP